MKTIKGIIPPMITPLKGDDQIDREGTVRLTEHILAGGVHALFLLGTTGEAQSLSYECRYDFVELVCRQVAGRVPVLVGVTDTSLDESVKLAAHAAKCGAVAVVAAAPYYFAPSQQELIEYYTALADALPLPLFLYNMPSHVKVFLEPATVKTLAEHPNIVGLKDSSANMTYFQTLLYHLGDREDFALYVGPEELTGESVVMGADGGVNGGANIFPELYVQMYYAACNRDVNTMRALQRKIMQISTSLYTVGKYGSSYLKGVKCSLSLMGIAPRSAPASARPSKRWEPPAANDTRPNYLTRQKMEITLLDYLVFFIFVGGVALFGCSFYFRSRKGAAAFTAAEGSLPTWVVGMSIFATFVSSISFLGLPGDAYKGNWNPFVFSLSIPIATWLAAKVFIPLYRGIDSVSAYHYLEMRFGYWARCYVAVCYLLTQLARVGSILLLLALPLNTMFGWDIQTIIVCTGIATLIYTLLGGIAAVVWTDAIQGIILIVGAIACAAILTFTMPEGPGQLFEIASAHGKFSLGSFGASLTEPTFWVVLIYGLFVNMQNYGIDQNYVQRYMTTRSTAEAVKSTLFGGLLYIPVSLVFVYIGTALFSYYTARPELLPAGTPSDQVFPWFIVHGLPTGLTGLVIASLFSAGMSTIATSINSSATIVLTDFAKRLSKKELSEKKSMRVLYATSFVVGALGIVMGLLMMRIDGVLDAWWKLASIFSGGMLGLFLLGVVCKTVHRAHAVVAVILGLLTIAWMSLSPLINEGSPFYRFHSPLHTYLTIVFGTTVIFLTGFLLTKLTNRKAENT